MVCPSGIFSTGVVPARALLGAEVRTGEDLLHAEHLHAFPAGLIDVLQRPLDLRVADGLERIRDVRGEGGLNEAGFHDSRHELSSEVVLSARIIQRLAARPAAYLGENASPRFRNEPWPLRPTYCPSSITTSPRESTVFVTPRTFIPS